MFNYTQFNSMPVCEMDDIAKRVWDYLLSDHTDVPADDFGSAVKEILRILRDRPKSRILLGE